MRTSSEQTAGVPGRRGAPERFLTTVLMTDIVGSTEHGAELGDSAWRDLVQLHHGLVRAALRRHGGRELDTAGDGFFAIFDAPAAAVTCALEIAAQVKELGIDIRAGLHVGEVEQIGPKVGGITVPIAARIMSAAGPGEVLVSATVRDLSAGAGLRFEDRGTRELTGVPGEWRIFTVAPMDAEPEPSGGSTDERALRRAAAVRRARSRPVWQRRPRLVTLTAIALALVLATTGLLIWKPWQSPALAFIGEDSVGVVDTVRAEIVGSIKVDQRPGGIAIDEGAVWVTNTGSDTVAQIDLSTRITTRLIDVGHNPLGVTSAAGSIWVANSGQRTITRIDTDTARVVGTLTVGNGPVAVAGTGSSVWVANLSDSTVARINAETGAVGDPIPVAAGPVALAADDSGVWIASADGAAVTHLDPASGVTLGVPIALSSRPIAIAIGAGSVWVAGADGSVTRIDPLDNRVTSADDVGRSLSAIAVTDDAVWVADRQGFLYQLDIANPSAIARTISTTSSPEALAVTGNDVWVAARASPVSHRGGTLRVVFPYLPDVDPLQDPFSVSQLEADGLVAYRRVGGTAGSALLPDLATALPKPTNGGRTYTFQLRQGLLYSTGQPVRPSDFRRAIERSFQTGQVFGNAYFTSVVGAEACAGPDGVERCDLSDGVVGDDSANTVTFHLSQPEPDFLYALATQFAYPVPEGVPMTDPVEVEFPGTGPYVVTTSTDTEIRLTRNPNFRLWDAEVRPDGFPDEIVWSAVEDPAETVAMVERGDADYAPLRGNNRVSPDVFARLRSQLPGQLHAGSSSVTAITMNTQLAPFDSPEVRQAVNMAIDRTHISNLHGGTLATTITCQVLPPGWTGYQPYCPYTVHPDPGGRWQAPDLEAARRLVEDSGTQGAKVVVGPVYARHADIRDYVVGVLSELGYEASADLETDFDYVDGATFDENRVQLGVWEINADTLAPSGFMNLFSCRGSTGLTNFCDPAYEALVAEASQLQATDPAAATAKWGDADRMVVDLALWAPLYNEGSDFVSERVGNFHYHNYYGVLLDQLWVQ